MRGRPLDVLENALDDPVLVRLKDGSVYYGALAGYDQHMNLVLDVTDAPLEGEPEPEPVDSVEDTTIIRGDNVVSINP